MRGFLLYRDDDVLSSGLLIFVGSLSDGGWMGWLWRTGPVPGARLDYRLYRNYAIIRTAD